MTDLHAVDWSKLPVPENDGAADHLPGSRLAPIHLTATDGGEVDLSAQPGTIVVYVYPMTGKPDAPLPDGWDLLPGARGCTPQACGFRDHFADLRSRGVNDVFGVSTQDSGTQREAAERLHLPFRLLSDRDLRLARSLKLPTFEAAGMTLLKRLTLVLTDGLVEHVFYPVFPPDRSAGDVLDWLKSRPR